VTWHTDEDLERLDAALMALPEDNDPMILAELDGFCAGLITCPEMIPPSVWLREVWGPGGPPEFESLAEIDAGHPEPDYGALQSRGVDADDVW